MAVRERLIACGVQPLAATCAFALGVAACAAAHGSSSRPEEDSSGGAGSAGVTSLTGGFAGTSGFGGIIEIGGGPCSLVSSVDAGPPVFLDEVIDGASIAQRELYSWTTADQLATLRADHQILNTTESQGLGPGYAATAIQQLAAGTAPGHELATILAGDLFAKKRYAWPYPWATRMGWPGETYGDQLIYIRLKAEAWVALIVYGQVSVIDMNNAPVALADALATPERIGAIYFVKDAAEGGASCTGNGSFTPLPTGTGYREYILGNEAMVESWSVGTQAMLDRLNGDIARITTFSERVRPCPDTRDAASFNPQVVCGWSSLAPLIYRETLDERSAYLAALAIPSENYIPAPAQLTSMIDALTASLFVVDPLTVDEP
jgi:hypothetical protein